MTAATTIDAEIAAVMADVVDYSNVAFAGITYGIGRREIPALADFPRVVWMLAGGGSSPPQKHAFPGGRRSLLTRLPVLRAICWGETVESTLALSSGVLAAMQRRYSGRLPYLGETWEEDPAMTDRGEACVLSWGMQIAVLDRAPTTATITTATPDASAAVLGDGTLHIGETS